MKLFIASVLVFCSAQLAFAGTSSTEVLKTKIAPTQDEFAASLVYGWIPLDSVCYTANDSSTSLRSCEDDAQAVNLMSNDRVAMDASCTSTYNVRGCPYSAQYAMVTRTLFIR